MATSRQQRRGISSVLAMIYLTLFGVLALGFYAQVNSSMMVARNEGAGKRAALAAESGLAFARYHLYQIWIPPLTTADQMIEQSYQDLRTQLNGTANLKGGSIGYVANTSIDIPAGANNYVELTPGGDRFHITITRKAGTRRMVVKVIGASPITSGGVVVGFTRAGIECEFDTKEHKSSIFSYGMASRGSVAITPANKIVTGIPAQNASILCLAPATPGVTIGALTNTLPTGVSGEITVLNGVTPSLVGPVSVDGITDKAQILAPNPDPALEHVHHIAPTEVPEWPVLDTALFKQYATNTYVVGKAVYDNTIIPPNTNPVFNGPLTIRGVLYVQQPNIVTIAGNVTMQAVVIGENKSVGTLATNIIQLSGNGGAKLPLDTLPVVASGSNPDIFKEVRTLTGNFIMAPGFDVTLTGNFGAITGDIAGDRVTVTGSAAATINGAVYTLTNNLLRIAGSAQVSIGANPYTHRVGSTFSERYIPTPDTYKEFNPN
jgi:hypothetical protein